MKPKALIMLTDGTNCETELAYSFKKAGADADIVHLKSIIEQEDPILEKKIFMDDYQIFAIPGGFSYGDYLGAGKVLAYELKRDLGEKLEKFISDGKLVIGICNGFQALVKSGFLPDSSNKSEQTVSLTYNQVNRFRDDWVKLVANENKCIWTKGIKEIYLPIAHGEGRFQADEETLKEIALNKQIVFMYADEKGPTMNFPNNPNGSVLSIAGICDQTGRVFGLMPHPERYHSKENNPEFFKNKHSTTNRYEFTGLKIFQNAAEYFK